MCVCARVYARAYECGQIVIRHTTSGHSTAGTQDTTGTHDHRKREEHQQAGKPEYICMIADNEKKYKKS